MDTQKLEIKYVPIGDVKPNEYNPKMMTKGEVDGLRASIEAFGMVDPLILNSVPGRENVLIGGHQRLEVCKLLGYNEVPVVYISVPDLTREQELCLRLSKNLGSWDYGMLANFDASLLKVVGFSDIQLEAFEGANPEVNEKELTVDNIGIKSECPKCGYKW